MSTPPAPADVEELDGATAEGGSLPAIELARLGLTPGTHLRLVPEPRRTSRGPMYGVLTCRRRGSG